MRCMCIRSICGSKVLMLSLVLGAILLLSTEAPATHLTISEKPGESPLLYAIAGIGLVLIFLAILFLLGVFVSRGVKKGWCLLISGVIVVVAGAILTAEEGGAALDHHDRALSLPLMALLASLGLGVFLLFFWAYKTGQFREVEEVKQRMLEREITFLYDDEKKEGGESDERDPG